jgi:hypothetical protein
VKHILSLSKVILKVMGSEFEGRMTIYNCVKAESGHAQSVLLKGLKPVALHIQLCGKTIAI